jgi:hypothetical protein
LRKSRKERTMRRETGESERVIFPMSSLARPLRRRRSERWG